MIVASTDSAAGLIAASADVAHSAHSPIESGSFADAMASRVPHRLPPLSSMASGTPVSFGQQWRALAQRLDEIGRQRLQAQSLSGELAGAWASGMDLPTLAMTMHRHARARASYNMSVMLSAKLVGVTAGALRQLTSAT